MDLKKQTIHALIWSAVSQGGKQGAQCIITVILASLLAPDDFGLLGMITVFTGFAAIFGELGISTALIQKQDVRDEHWYSAFWLNMGIGLFLTAVFYLSASSISSFYRRPELTPFLQVVSIRFVLSALTIVQQTMLTKELNFKALAVRDVASVVISGAFGVFLAYRGFGVWSLVFQMIVQVLMSGFLLWSLSPWRPRMAFSPRAIKEIFPFSAHMTGFNILNYFSKNTDYLLIGKFLGPVALGLYALAFKLMLYPLQNVSLVIGKVMFPVFSKMNDDVKRVRTSYLKMLRAISLVTFPMLVFIFTLAPELTHLLGPQWEPATGLIRILSLCGIIQSIGGTIGNVRLAQGGAALHFRLGLLNSVLSVLSVLIGLRWGVHGVAIAYTVFSWLWYHFSFYVTLKPIGLPLGMLLDNLKCSYFASASLLLFLLAIKEWTHFDVLPNIMVVLSFGGVFYLAVLLITKQVVFLGKKGLRFNF